MGAYMKKIIAMLVLLGGFSARAEITVIGNDNVSLTAGEVAEVFSGDKTTVGGVKLVLADNKSAIGEFAQKVLKSDAGKYSSAWAKKAFREAIPAPKSKANDGEAIEFVKSTPGGVSYIGGAAPAGVKTLGKY
jgi:hypothetical protein